MEVKINRIKIRGYRSCFNTVIKFDSNLSIIIGVNGAGKTNILKALVLLREILRKTDRFERDNLRNRQNHPKVELDVDLTVGENVVSLKALAYLGNQPRRKISEEVVYAKQKWKINGKSVLNFNPLNFERMVYLDYKKKIKRSSLGKLYRYRITAEDFLGKEQVDILSAARSYINGITYFSATQFTDPGKASSIFELDGDRLGFRSYGLEGNHDKILADFYFTSKKNPSLFRNFLRVIGPDNMALISNIIFEEYDLPFSSIDFSPVGSVKKIRDKKKMVLPIFMVGNKKLVANQLSEGTFKTIVLLYHLISSTEKFIMVEEPEVCVHHGLLKKVMNTIDSIAHKKQIIISTHSEYLLDKVSSDKVILVKNQKGKGTSAVNIMKDINPKKIAAIKEYLENTGGLGELMKTGGLDV